MGNTPLYLANNIFKFEAGDKLKDSELYGINGFTTKVTIIKSRSNRAGQEAVFVFDQVKGLDNVLTNLLYTKNEKILEGGGLGYHLPGDDTKFRLSTFKQKYKEDKDFRIFFKKLIRDEYRKFINKEDMLEDQGEEDEEGADVESKPAVTSPLKKKKKK